MPTHIEKSMGKLRDFYQILFEDRSLLVSAFEALDIKQFKKRLIAQTGRAQFPTIEFSDVVGTDELEIINYTYLGGNSLPTDMALIKELARSIPGCVFLEIGSWRGETMSNVATVAEECYSLTLGVEDMQRLGMSGEFRDSHGLFTKGIKNLKVFYHDSLTFDFGRLPRRPNLVFVDGDHSYEAVKKDTENAFKVLNSEDDVIVWHDYGYNTEEVRVDVMAAIYDGTPDHLKKHLYHVSNTMCAIYTRKNYPQRFAQFPEMPNKTFELNIRIKPLSNPE